MVNYSKDNWVVNQIMPPLGVDNPITKCGEIAILLKLKKCLSTEDISGSGAAKLNLSSLPNTPVKSKILPNDCLINKHTTEAKKKLLKISKVRHFIDIKEHQSKVNNNESMLGYLVEKPIKKSINCLKNKESKFTLVNDSTQTFINNETPVLHNENLKCIKFYEPLENISNNPQKSKTNKSKTKKGKNTKEKQPGSKIDSFLVPQSGDDLLPIFNAGQKILKPISPKQVLTDYFPVIKRSSRRCKIDIDKEFRNNLENLILNKCEDGLKVVHFEDRGRGVVATRKFDKNDFVVEYAGDLITPTQAKLRELKYKVDSSIGCYMYYFELGGKQYCVDATAETGRLGRLVNHSRKLFNCKTKALFVRNNIANNAKEPKLILVTTRDIEAGEEFLYDYGERDKEIIKANPWLLS